MERELDGWEKHMLSTKKIVIKNPEPSFEERIKMIKQEIECKWEIELLKYGIKSCL